MQCRPQPFLSYCCPSLFLAALQSPRPGKQYQAAGSVQQPEDGLREKPARIPLQGWEGGAGGNRAHSAQRSDVSPQEWRGAAGEPRPPGSGTPQRGSGERETLSHWAQARGHQPPSRLDCPSGPSGVGSAYRCPRHDPPPPARETGPCPQAPQDRGIYWGLPFGMRGPPLWGGKSEGAEIPPGGSPLSHREQEAQRLTGFPSRKCK